MPENAQTQTPRIQFDEMPNGDENQNHSNPGNGALPEKKSFFGVNLQAHSTWFLFGLVLGAVATYYLVQKNRKRLV